MTLLLAASAAATPYRPADDALVLERLPAGAVSASNRSAPRDPVTAAALARDYVERARREGDPRFLGYAEGVLRSWWNVPAPPAPVLLLRATLLQSRHRFDDALRDLNQLLADRPGEPQALLTRATVLRVKGRYAEAAASCAQLNGTASAFVTDLCLASVRSLAGELPAMAAVLDDMEEDSLAESPAMQAWYRAERADMAERLGHDAVAQQRYREAMALDGGDPLLRAAAADLALRLGHADEALRIAGENPMADVLRLRTVIALRRLGRPRADLETAIADGYAAAHRRGEDLHLREEARFTLEVLHDAPRALELAQRNWAVQHEPGDALILLATAQAAAQPQAAAALRDWLRAARTEDARLRS